MSVKKRNNRNIKDNSMKKYLTIAIVVIAAIVVLVLLVGRLGSGDLPNVGQVVNVTEQAKQSIMVLPSDKLLQKCGALKITKSMGKTLYFRDYQAFLLSNSTNQHIIRSIQNSFNSFDYPLMDLEQSLKSIENQILLDEADGVQKDAKTLLLTSVRPDIIIEFDYESVVSAASRDKIIRTLSYNIVLLDAFSNKAIGSINDFKTTQVESDENVEQILYSAINDNVSKLSKQITNYFEDILENGREITFRVATSSTSPICLQDMYNDEGHTYSDWIRTWVKTNAKLGTATMQTNSNREMNFVNVRIKNHQEDGTQYNAYDFADEFRKEFYRTFKVQVSNNTQGLANAFLLIK